MADLCVFLFGPPHVDSADGRRVFERPRAATALLAYLLLHPAAVPRRQLVAQLWSGLPPERARRCLNTALWRLRRALESPGGPTRLVTGPNGEIAFNRDSDIWVDAIAYEERMHALLRRDPRVVGESEVRDWHNALSLYGAELLVGFDDDWAEAERHRLRQLHTEALVGLMRVHRARGEVRETVALGEQVLADDLLREDVHRELMSVFLETGRRGMALRQYEICRTAMREELGTLPDTRTQELFRLGLDDSSADASSPVTPLDVAPPQPARPPAPTDLVDVAGLGDLADSLEQAARALAECARLLSGLRVPAGRGEDRGESR